MPSLNSPSTVSFSDLASALQGNGLEILGTFQPDDGEILFSDRSEQPGIVVIVGNVSSAVWPHYEAQRKTREGLTLDHWTEDVVGRLSRDFGIEAVYPFEGPPYHPFMRWAQRTGTLFSSPIGLTIHPEYGLWVAFRAALLIDRPFHGENTREIQPVTARHPCDTCENRPCLTACPVGAFTGEGYDFEACLDHLATPVNDCRQGGCLARVACPVGKEHRYQRGHAAFHMQQLIRAHGRS